MNIYLIKLFEDIKELYQDYLQQINNKRIQKTFFDKIITKIKVIIYVIDKKKFKFTSNETKIKEVIKNNGYSNSQSGGYLNTENNLLPLINLIYDNIIQNITSELTYLSLNTPQKDQDQVASQNSSNPQNIIFNQKTKKIDFDLKLRQYLKEKKDIDKIIEKKLKEFKGDIDDNLKNISNELTLLKDPLTPENKTEKPRLNTIKIQLENNLKTEQNNLKLSQSQIHSYKKEMERLEELIRIEANQQKSRLESSLEIQRQSHVKENKNYNLIEQKIKTIMSDIKINEEKLNKIIQKENQYKYKKEILETKQTSYTNIKKEIDNNLSELEKPKEGLNNSTLKDLFNKTFNNLIQLTNNLSEINKKIQYKKSNNKIYTLLDNDMLSKISLISKNKLNNNKNQAIFIKKITNYYTIKESKKSITNKNSSKIYIFMNSLLEEYNKIKDTKNTTVELFFQFIIKIDDELTKSIMKLLDKINQQKLKKINNYSIEKIQYLNTLNSKIIALNKKIITSGAQTSQNKINSAKQKSESKIKRILAYTDVIKLYFSNIIYLILYLSTYYL